MLSVRLNWGLFICFLKNPVTVVSVVDSDNWLESPQHSHWTQLRILVERIDKLLMNWPRLLGATVEQRDWLKCFCKLKYFFRLKYLWSLLAAAVASDKTLLCWSHKKIFQEAIENYLRSSTSGQTTHRVIKTHQHGDVCSRVWCYVSLLCLPVSTTTDHQRGMWSARLRTHSSLMIRTEITASISQWGCETVLSVFVSVAEWCHAGVAGDWRRLTWPDSGASGVSLLWSAPAPLLTAESQRYCTLCLEETHHHKHKNKSQSNKSSPFITNIFQVLFSWI